MESLAGDKQANLGKLARFAEQAAARGVEIVAFPECLPHRLLVPAPAQRAAAPGARRARPRRSELRAAARARDAAPGDDRRGAPGSGGAGRLPRYLRRRDTRREARPPSQAARLRERPSVPARRRHTVFDTPHGCRVAVLICCDNNLVENVRVAALRGADILLAPHQTGGCRPPIPHLMGVIERGCGRAANGSGGDRGGIARREGQRMADALAADARA